MSSFRAYALKYRDPTKHDITEIKVIQDEDPVCLMIVLFVTT